MKIPHWSNNFLTRRLSSLKEKEEIKIKLISLIQNKTVNLEIMKVNVEHYC